MRGLVAGCRPWPSFLIVGAQKSGSTFLYRNLVAQPGVLPAYKKEIHYFDLHHDEGPGWYRAHFPLNLRSLFPLLRNLGEGGAITGESSPYYLFHPGIPGRVRALLPEVRLIAVLRHPVERAYSHYQHEFRRGVETAPPAEAFAAEGERLAGEDVKLLADPGYVSRSHRKFSYLARGRYAEQLLRWLEVFPPRQLLVLKSEEMYADPGAALARAMAFLGRPGSPVRVPHSNKPKDYQALEPDIRHYLSGVFAPHNEALYRLLAERSEPGHSLEIEPWE